MRAALIGVGLVMAPTAHAENDLYVERPLAFAVHGGAGTPLGFYGVTASYAVLPQLSVEVGAGYGLVGGQVAGQARARVVRVGDGWLAIGSGVSSGHYEHRDPFYGIEYLPTVVDRAYWANGELSFERREASGLDLRIYAGAGVVFAGERQLCPLGNEDTMPCSGSARGLWSPYVGVSLGYATPL